MRGQRPTLASLLAWVALMALVLGSLPMLSSTVTDPVPSAMLQIPVEERGGGEVPLHEQAPAKLRRASLSSPAPTAEATATRRSFAACWSAALPGNRTMLARVPLAAADVRGQRRHASAQPPRTDAPGRRQQRGQAPPLA